MKFLFLICGAFALSMFPEARGQEPALPSPETQDTTTPTANRSAAQVPAPLPTSPIPQLIPDDVVPARPTAGRATDLQQLDDAFKANPINQAARDQSARVEWRKLRNIISNDPELKIARAKAERARTDLQKRKLLRVYYELYFAKMLARTGDPEMKVYLTERKNEALRTLLQPRVRPERSPTVSAESTPPARR